MPLDEAGEPDFGPVVRGSLAAWRAANPVALVANVSERMDLTNSDLVSLCGLRALSMNWVQEGITDAALFHLRRIHTLSSARALRTLPLCT